MLVRVASHSLGSSRIRSSGRRRCPEDVCEGSFPSAIVSSSLFTILLGHFATVLLSALAGTGPFSGSRRNSNQFVTPLANYSANQCSIKWFERVE
jgi:hypothetical protein